MQNTSNPLIGLGLRPLHYNQVLSQNLPIDWFEVHSENFFHQGGPLIDKLLAVRQKYALSLHGVGLSLGSASLPSTEHLQALKQLIDKVSPFLVSEHLSWSVVDGHYFPDLLPIPYTQESLEIFSRNINIVQDFIQRPILLENPSSYVEYSTSTMGEPEFLSELCKRTGAKILLDINNVFVSCWNHQWSIKNYLDIIPQALIEEIHLSGHSTKTLSSGKILRIDTHDQPVDEKVWECYQYMLPKICNIPTLIEWDAQLPSLAVMLGEAHKIKQCLNLSSEHA